MRDCDRSCVIRLADAQRHIPDPAGERSVLVLQRGTLDVKLSSTGGVVARFRSSLVRERHEAARLNSGVSLGRMTAFDPKRSFKV